MQSWGFGVQGLGTCSRADSDKTLNDVTEMVLFMCKVVTSTVHPKVSSLARSETHILDQGFANMSLGDCSPSRYQRDSSPPPYFPDDNPQSTYSPGGSPPRPRSRESDASEEERRRIKQAAKEQRRKEKAAARELQEQEKAARREEKAKREAKVIAELQNIAIQLQKNQNSKDSGGNDATVGQKLAELKSMTENWQASDARRHQEQAKFNEERHLEQTKLHHEPGKLNQERHLHHTKLHHEQLKLQHEQAKLQDKRHLEHTNLLQERNQEYLNGLQEIVNTQVITPTQ